MTIYYSIYVILGITSLICGYFEMKENSVKKTIGFVMFNCLFLMLAFRHPSMGHDLKYLTKIGYLGRFEYIATVDWDNIFDISVQHYEKGYIVFNKLVSLLSTDRQFFMGACAFLSLLPIIYVICKKSVAPIQSLIIYMGLPVFLIIYSGLRQALAIGICFLSILFIQDKKLVKFVLLVLLASTLHKSSIIFLCAYPLYNLKMTQSWRWVSVVTIPIVYILRYPLFAIFSKIFKDNAETKDTGAITLFLVFTLVYIFCIIYSDESNEQNGLRNLFFMACLCQAFSGVYNLAMRVGYYFMIPLALLLPLIIKGMDEKIDKPIFSIIITICFATFALYCIKGSTWAGAYPYYFFWEEV